MADEESTAAEPTDPDTEESGSGSRPWLRVLAAAVFLLAVVGVECVVAMYVFPSEEDTREMVMKLIASEGDKPQLPEQPLNKPETGEEEWIEKELHSVNLTKYITDHDTTLRLNANTYATVNKDNEEDFDELFGNKQHRIKEQIGNILRSAEESDFADPKLGLIKRKILETVNRTLGQPLLHEIIIPDFSYMEQ